MTQFSFLDVRTSAANGVAEHPKITAFMERSFPGRSLSVYREVLPGLVPGVESAPFVAFGPFSHGQPDNNPHAIEHSLPVGIFMRRAAGDFEDAGGGVMILPGADLLDELAALTEQAVSAALMASGYPFEQDSYLPDDVAQFGDFIMSFYLYRVRTQRYL